MSVGLVEHEVTKKSHSHNNRNGCSKSKFRPPGSPAGTWPHTPWWHCFFYDPYERICVWSHLLPGLFLLCTAVYGYLNGVYPYAVFGISAATTHLCSAITHVYPDSHALEKLDHYGITALILGTPLSAMMALGHAGIPTGMLIGGVLVAIAAALPPLPRVLGFAGGVVLIFGMYATQIGNLNILVQMVLYALGGWCFLRNGGHQRWCFLADHHLLHYTVTVSCCLHLKYIHNALAHNAASIGANS